MVSSGPEAKARVSLDSKQFEAAIRGIRNELTKMDAATKKTGKEFGTLGMQAKKVGQEIKTLGTTGRDNLKKIGNSATVMSAQMRNAARGMQTDTTSIAQGTRQIGQAATQMGSQGQAGFNQIGQAATATQPIIRQTAVEMNNARMATLGMVSSVAGLGTGFVTLETTMTNIPKRLNAIAKAESLVETQQVSLQRQNTSLQRLELQLEKMRTEGKKTAEEVAIQERKIIDTRANIELYTGKLADAQEDLNLKHADYADTLKLMATSIFQTFLSAGVTVTMLLTQQASAAGITTSKYVSMKMATLANSKALNFLKIDLATAKANFLGYSSAAAASASASTAAATGIGRVSLGIKGLYAALGPIGWTIIGITAIWQAWEHNLFGFQDAVRETLKWLQKMWETLKWIIPVIGLVDEAFRKFDPEGYNKATAGITEGIDKIGKSSEDAATEIETLGTTMTSTAPAVDQFANLMEDQSQLAVLHAQNMELGAGAVLDFGMAELGSAVAIDRTTGAIRNQTAAMKDATNAMNAYAAAGSKKNDNYPRSTASYEEIIRAHDKNKTSFLSRELDQLRRAIEQRDKDTRFGQLAGQNIVHSSSTYAGFLKTDRGYSRIPLSTFLRSENFGHGGRNIVQGDSISDEYRQLFELAGITLGGSADDAISKFNERSGNNYANPGFQHGGGVSPALGRLYEMTGGRLGQNRGGWTGNRNRKREQDTI